MIPQHSPQSEQRYSYVYMLIVHPPIQSLSLNFQSQPLLCGTRGSTYRGLRRFLPKAYCLLCEAFQVREALKVPHQEQKF